MRNGGAENCLVFCQTKGVALNCYIDEKTILQQMILMQILVGASVTQLGSKKEEGTAKWGSSPGMSIVAWHQQC